MEDFSPQVILSKVWRDRSIEKFRKQPSIILRPTASSAAVLIPLCVVNEEVHVLYTLRSSNLKNHAGQVCFPGGKSDDGETAQNTALRETEEELGIPRENIDVWTEIPPIQGGSQFYLITPVIGFIKKYDINSLKINTFEVEEVFTVPLRHLCDPSNQGFSNFTFRNEKVGFPVFLFNKHKIWGLTAIITHFFLLNLLPNHLYCAKIDMSRKFEIEDLVQSKL